MLGRGALHLRHAPDRGLHLLPAKGAGGARRQRPHQLQPSGRRPLHASVRVESVGGDQLLDPVVLRELHPGAIHAQGPRHPGTGREPVRAGRARGGLQPELGRCRGQSHLRRLLLPHGQAPEVARLPHHQAPADGAHPPLIHAARLAAAMGRVPRARLHHQGVHAPDHRDQVGMARRDRAPLLQEEGSGGRFGQEAAQAGGQIGRGRRRGPAEVAALGRARAGAQGVCEV
mmetsp:Transcript_10492/g.34831  ORF Transcript_10492/g.34831 Transcript_10492/m.34831 type:complete len:230 (-) Transcript_10492:154-843(-)